MGGMGVLVGTFDHRMDSKGRMVLPARFREELGNQVVATIGIDRCVALYSLPNWHRLLEKLQNLPMSKGRTRDFLRVLLASATEMDFDSMGRILLPQLLRQHGGIKQEVAVIGVGDHLEIWDSSNWTVHRGEILEALPSIAEEVEGL